MQRHSHNFKNLTGKRFNRLFVIKLVKSGAAITLWECACDCGNTVNIASRDLLSGHSKSCGCLKIEMTQKRFSTHGMTDTKFYNIWKHIIARTQRKTSKDYKYYGKRGIVCKWKSFEEFKKDMYGSFLKHLKKYGSQNTTIDRIDTNGHYELKNCRWATRKDQVKNRRRWVLPVRNELGQFVSK